jgi:hypothetical protein
MQVDNRPDAITNSSSIQLGFSSSKNPATFFCSLSSQGRPLTPLYKPSFRTNVKTSFSFRFGIRKKIPPQLTPPVLDLDC